MYVCVCTPTQTLETNMVCNLQACNRPKYHKRQKKSLTCGEIIKESNCGNTRRKMIVDLHWSRNRTSNKFVCTMFRFQCTVKTFHWQCFFSLTRWLWLVSLPKHSKWKPYCKKEDDSLLTPDDRPWKTPILGNPL